MKFNKMKGMLYGLIIGDCLGVPSEFSQREHMKLNPCKGYEVGGVHDQLKYSWSDDTSMTLALIDSYNKLLRFDEVDIMNKYLEWFDDTKYTSNGIVFDIGIATQRALNKYRNNKDISTCGDKNYDTLGNGTIMRISPIFFMEDKYDKLKRCVSLTHDNYISYETCKFYFQFLERLKEKNSDKLLAWQEAYDIQDYEIKQIFPRNIDGLKESNVKSTGYVVDTLISAVWCFLNTNNFDDAVLKAVNLGGDTDTIASLTGAIAGYYYSISGISDSLLEPFVNRGRNTEHEKLYDMFSEFFLNIELKWGGE